MPTNNVTLGHYTATWNALDTGKTEEGWSLEIIHKGEKLRFDEFSENVIDLIMRGADVFVEAVLKEWKAAAVQSIIWPFSSTFGKLDCPGGVFAVAGSKAKPLVLTAASCPPAGTDGPATITFHNSIMDPEVASRINFNNLPRLIPVRFMTMLKDIDAGSPVDYRYFSVT